MTREEAITNLNMISVAFVEPVTKEQRKLIDDTFEMAISALEQTDIEQKAQEYEKAFMDGFESCSDLFTRNKEQQPCEDAISREAVNTLVDELARAISDERCHIPQRGRDTGHIMHDILDLPSVTQKSGKWIPVSEELPEENKQVLIQYRTRYREDVNLFDVTSRADYNYWQGIGREIDVIAWMPLPEPYKAESEAKK